MFARIRDGIQRRVMHAALRPCMRRPHARASAPADARDAREAPVSLDVQAPERTKPRRGRGFVVARAATLPRRREGAQVQNRMLQNVMLQLLMKPVSPPALSFTCSRQLPLRASLDRFTV